MKKPIKILFTFLVIFLSVSIVKADEGFCYCSEDGENYVSADESCTSDSNCSSICSARDLSNAVCVKNSEDALKKAKVTAGYCVCDGGVPLENVACNDDISCGNYCFQFGYTTGTCKIDVLKKDREKKNQGKPSTIEIDPTVTSCEKTLGKNFSRLLKAGITIFQVACVIFAIIKSMMILIPPITSKNMNELAASGKKLVLFAGILIAALLFRSILVFVGRIANLDVSCITFILRSFR